MLALAAATLKLVVVQTVQAGDLAAASERQAITNIALPAVRGEITDRDGNPLAFSAEARALVTNPRHDRGHPRAPARCSTRSTWRRRWPRPPARTGPPCSAC